MKGLRYEILDLKKGTPNAERDQKILCMTLQWKTIFKKNRWSVMVCHRIPNFWDKFMVVCFNGYRSVSVLFDIGHARPRYAAEEVLKRIRKGTL